MPLTDAEKANYERAAVALEKHERLTDLDGVDFSDPWVAVAWKAWDQCNENANLGTCSDVDTASASLLRECIAKGEPLK